MRYSLLYYPLYEGFKFDYILLYKIFTSYYPLALCVFSGLYGLYDDFAIDSALNFKSGGDKGDLQLFYINLL